MKQKLKDITHIIFDVDGTLYDKKREYIKGRGTIEDVHEFMRYFTYSLALEGRDSLDIIAEQVIESYLKADKEKMIFQKLSEFPDKLKKEFHDLVKIHGSNGNLFVKEFGTENCYFAKILSNINFELILAEDTELKKMIEYFKEHYKLGILTNEVNKTIELVIPLLGLSVEDFYLETKTDYKIFCRETKVSKPDPSSFKQMLEINDIKPQNAVYVGDSFSKDILPPLSLGMNAIHVKNFGSVIKIKDNYIEIGSIYDLEKLFKND